MKVQHQTSISPKLVLEIQLNNRDNGDITSNQARKFDVIFLLNKVLDHCTFFHISTFRLSKETWDNIGMIIWNGSTVGSASASDLTNWKWKVYIGDDKK